MRRKTTAEVAARLYGTQCTTVLDVGARWGAEGAWYRLAPLAKLVGFEADAAECERLNRAATPGSGERFVPVALGEHDGPSTLHITREPGCSSLLPPEPEAIRRYPLLSVMTPARTLEVKLRRLEGWAREDGCGEIAFMKLDTQGTELSILKGAGSVLDDCLGIEAEVEFFPLYQGQPLFSEVELFLRERGLLLWRLSHLVHYSQHHGEKLGRREVAVYDGVTAPSSGGAGRLCWGHALFFRDHASLPLTDRASARRLLTLASLLDAAGEIDGVVACLRRATSAPHDVVDEGSKRALLAHLREVEREL